MKKILFIALSAVLLTTGCSDIKQNDNANIIGGNDNESSGSDNNTGGSETPAGVSIYVDTKSVTLDLTTNTTYKLNAYTAGSDGSNVGGVTYKSENTQIAEVTNDGTITAIKAGFTFINVTSIADNTITTFVEVVISEQAGETGAKYKITANPSSLTIDKNSNKLLNQISLTFTPELETGSYIYYESKDKSIAKINGSGDARVIQGVALGNTFLRIGVTGETGSYVDIPVLVKEAGLPEPVIYPDIEPTDAETYKNRIYLKIKFDAFSTNSSTYLYISSNAVGINAVTFQNDGETCNSSVCSGTLIKQSNGFINPYGFCEKYGCTLNGGGNNTSIAQKNIGTTYYAGNNNLFVTYKNQTGIVNHTIYIVLETLPAQVYTRDNINFPINWDEYNPAIHKNIAKFTITYRDKQPTVVFDGFESK